MKHHLKTKATRLLPSKLVLVIAVLLGAVSIMSFALVSSNSDKPAGEKLAVVKDSIGSVRAFRQVYTVLTSARCMNCHPAGNVPLQGEDHHLHAMFPQRGTDGHGMYAMKCSNCHQSTNTAGLHTPPGNPKWGLPPSDMKMVFQGKTAHQLAKQIADPNTNGHKNMQQLIAHASDTLVKWAWHPGGDRTVPPLTYAQFKKAWITWIQKGAYAPSWK
jgi:hypothetical protein